MIADFIRFYPGHTMESVLSMYCATFYSLIGAMHRLRGEDDVNDIQKHAAIQSGGDAYQTYLKDAKRRAGGGHALLEEVRAVKAMGKRM